MAEEKLTLKTFLESSQFIKGAKKVKTALGSIGKAASTLGATMTGAMALRGVKAMIDLAGEAEKTDLRFKRVFGSMSSEVNVFATSLSSDLGRVKADVEAGMVSFQAFFQGLGFGGKEAAKYSQKMQALSLDLASFFQIQDTNAQKRFLAALAGSPEVLDQFGINLKEAALQQELLNMGLSTSVQKTNEMTKTTARLSIIMRAMSDNGIVGDAKRTMITYGNKMKIAGSSLKDLAITIGDKFLPVAKEMLDMVISLSNGINRLFNGGKKLSKLNKEQQEQFLRLGNALTNSTVKGSQTYEIILNKIILLYPKFLKGLDRATVTNEQLKNKVNAINSAFQLQQKIIDNSISLQEKKIKLDEISNRILFIQEQMQKNIANGERRDKEGKVEKNKQLETELDGTIGVMGATQKLGFATIEYNAALAENVRLLSLRDEIFDDTFIKLKEQEDVVKPRLSDGGVQFDPKSKGDTDEFTDLTDMERLIDALSAIPKKIPKIKLLFKDYFSLGGIDFVRDTIIKDGKIIHDSFIDLQGTMSNALEGFASNMGQAFGGAIQTALKGGANLGTAIRLATKEALGGMAADLAANAMYFGILALGYKAGIIATGGATAPSAVSAAKSAGIFAAGATLLGGVSAAISGKGGGGTTPSSRNTGGSANGGTGVGGGTFTDFMDSIRGEQVFRLAGNDLVTAINRTNTFQGSIGG